MKTALFFAIALSFSSCGESFQAVINGLTDIVGSKPAEATTTGFDPTLAYPSRNTTYDIYLKEESGLSQAQLSKLFHHIAMPQSHSAMVGLLGYPTHEQGSVAYWAIEGGSNELAVFYEGEKAIRYTVGY